MNHIKIKAALAGSLLGASLVVGACYAAPESPQPATWMEHSVIVELNKLPTTYTCDDLWYKFRDVLHRIGARPDWKITTQGCSFTKVAQGNSPQVQLDFWLPQALPGAQAHWATLKAVKQTVTLAPDSQPHSLDKSDCHLVRQIANSLLPALPVRVTESSLDCGSSSQTSHDFKVSIQTLMPIAGTAGKPAAA